MKMAYNLGEIFEIARQIERNGAEFYKEAATLEALADARAILLSLAEQERGHERTFAQMRAALSAKTGLIPGGADEATVQYVRAIAGQYVFNKKQKPAQLFTGMESGDDIILTAIGRENDAIAFYAGIRELVLGEENRSSIDAIIKEERRHAAALAALLGASGRKEVR
jgi:rubrerythrin